MKDEDALALLNRLKPGNSFDRHKESQRMFAVGTSAEFPPPPADGRTFPNTYELITAWANLDRLRHGEPAAACVRELDNLEINRAWMALGDRQLVAKLHHAITEAWAAARANPVPSTLPPEGAMTHAPSIDR